MISLLNQYARSIRRERAMEAVPDTTDRQFDRAARKTLKAQKRLRQWAMLAAGHHGFSKIRVSST